jgi:hypothetical protein
MLLTSLKLRLGFNLNLVELFEKNLIIIHLISI